MKILLVGGGTAGHITPLLAVAHELKRLEPAARLIYLGERQGRFASVLDGQTVIDERYTIFAGKFRRYHGESWLTRLLDVRTNVLNLRDAFYTLIGLWQSFWLLGRLRPDIIFIKGGYVGVPVGLSAGWRHIPYVTHDSDTLPGLANRLISRRASAHAVGMPKEFYAYPPEKTFFVGIPLSVDYQRVTPELKWTYRKELHIGEHERVLFVTGGSNGAEVLNQAMAGIAEPLLMAYPDLRIIHQAGKDNLGLYQSLPAVLSSRVACYEFMDAMYRSSGAADVVLARAGATTLAELAVQGKASLIVPNPLLTGGHQLANAEHLAKTGAIVVVEEGSLRADPQALLKPLRELLDSTEKRQKLEQAFSQLGHPETSREVAQLLLKILGNPKQKTHESLQKN